MTSTAQPEDEGVHIGWVAPYLLAFVGLFVAVLSAPGVTSLVTSVVVFACVTIGAFYVGWRRGSGVFILMSCVVPAVMLAFLVVPLQGVSGWMAAFVCDEAHPVLGPIVEHVPADPTRSLSAATLVAQACFTTAGADPQVTAIPGVLWAVILVAWFLLALVAGVFAFAICRPERAMAAGRR